MCADEWDISYRDGLLYLNGRNRWAQTQIMVVCISFKPGGF